MEKPNPEAPGISRPPVARVEGVRMEFGKTVALDGLSFEVGPGAILGLVGPNGAGKTTALRVLSGILPPVTGTVEICGFDLQKESLEAKHRLGFVPDDPRLFDAMTVGEHLRFAASLYGVSDYQQRAAKLLDRFDLGMKRDILCGDLSRGMRHKAGICCALLYEPTLLMLDEPLAGLDPKAIHEMKAVFRDRSASGQATIISSHLLYLIEDVCTDLLVIDHGLLRYRGPVAEFRKRASAWKSHSLEEVFLEVTGSGGRENTKGHGR